MSGQSHYLGVRVHPQVAEAVGQLAEQSGRSVSDVVREALEARLAQSPHDRQSASAKPSCDFNPYARVAAAARGSLEAQRWIGDFLLDQVLSGERGLNAIIEALVFARLAASHGQPSDQLRVISLIGLLAEAQGEDDGETADAIARLRWLSMQPGIGSDEMDANLDALMKEACPEVLAMAGAYSEAMTAAASDAGVDQ